MILTRLVLLATLLANCTGCIISGCRSDFYNESEQKNKYFVVDRKNVDYLTPATVLSLRQGMIVDVDNIGQYLNSMCTDYLWMNENRFIYIFESSKYSSMFDSFGIENIKKRKPVEKFIASYNPDEMSVTFYPLLDEKRKKVYLDKNWCRNGGS